MAGEVARYYAEHHPAEAARQMESASVPEIAAFLTGLDSETSAALLTHLLPTLASECLYTLPPQIAASVASELPPTVSARLLVSRRGDQRKAILAALPEDRVRQLRHLLRYPEGSVGTAMIVDTLCCRDTATIRSVKSNIRKKSGSTVPLCFVLDDGGRPMGVVAVTKLLQAREREQVSVHMRRLAVQLRARADLQSVVDHPAWMAEEFLPVVHTDNVFIGVLSRTEVYKRLLASHREARRGGDLSGTLVALADLFWQPGAELLVKASSEEKE